jgi:tRNA nucleotidyltransferase (CCA-adding enzyme)
LSLGSVVQKVVEGVTPQNAQRKAVGQAVRIVLERFEASASSSTVKPVIKVGGSFAHDTWLPEDTDVDFFMLYPPTIERGRFEEMGLSLAEEALAPYAPRKRYAEHPYIEAQLDGVTINAVPCYMVSQGQWKSAADRSPFHTEYLKGHLTATLKAQVRVLKKFLKAQGLYGAEIKVMGFSGYACEVLILKYGSFENLLRAAADWRKGEIISVEGGEEKAKVLFRDAPFILLDPVDTTRNLGSAVSPQNLAEFVYLARCVLREPSVSFFESAYLKPVDRAPKHVRNHTVLLRFGYRERSEDILWGELRKTASGLASHLEKDGVQVMRYCVAAEGGRASIAFLVAPERLPQVVERRGPEIFLEDATERFLSSARAAGGSWWLGEDFKSRALQVSAHFSPTALIVEYMKNPVGRVGFAKGLAEDAAETYSVVMGEKAYRSRNAVDQEALRRLAGYRFS